MGQLAWSLYPLSVMTTWIRVHNILESFTAGSLQQDSLDGASHRETIVSYGPFVINTEDEITMAFRDSRNGAMGLLP